MKEGLLFITNNEEKIQSVKRTLETLNITFEAQGLPLVEIQSESIVDIAEHKAIQAYEILKKPLIISDHGWFIPTLNGFPGAFMKYVNKWFIPEDILSLMQRYKNREIFKREVLVYVDQNVKKTFQYDIKGRILDKPQGKGLPVMRVVTLSKSRKSVAECIAEGIDSYDYNPIWQEFARWYQKRCK